MMARKVFFSFHYSRDVRRIQQVRQSWVIRPGDEAQPFYDKAEFEAVKKKVGGIKNWIDAQLAGTSVTVVLFGYETHTRPWVKYEIERSHALGKGIVAVDVHNIKDPQLGSDYQGRNPLDDRFVSGGLMGRRAFSQIYSTYDWVNNNGYQNLPSWIEAAAKAANR